MTVQQRQQTIFTWVCDQTGETEQTTSPGVPPGWAHMTVVSDTINLEVDLSPAVVAQYKPVWTTTVNAIAAGGVTPV